MRQVIRATHISDKPFSAVLVEEIVSREHPTKISNGRLKKADGLFCPAFGEIHSSNVFKNVVDRVGEIHYNGSTQRVHGCRTPPVSDYPISFLFDAAHESKCYLVFSTVPDLGFTSSPD